jgi:VIT1/CCC1 family predicted Fe2+/Mn2+ transporter
MRTFRNGRNSFFAIGRASVRIQTAHVKRIALDGARRTVVPTKRLLDPMDRISEVLFGLIMVLTITCSISVASAGQTEVHEVLLGALGCNLAWGIIDAFMYLMTRLSERGQEISALRALRMSKNAHDARNIISECLPSMIAGILSNAEIATLTDRLERLPEPRDQPRLTGKDCLAALGVFLLVIIATLPVLIPFVALGTDRISVRISNAIAVAMLFGCGFAFGRHINYHPWRMGIFMVVVGVVLVGIAIAFGG